MTTKAQWAELGIQNPYELVKRYTEQTGGYGVYLAKSVNDGARYNMGIPDGWIVIRPGYQTDPENKRGIRQGNKVFYSYKSTREQAAVEAIAWTSERYSLSGEFVQIPGFGRDLFPKEIADWAKAYPRSTEASRRKAAQSD